MMDIITMMEDYDDDDDGLLISADTPVSVTSISTHNVNAKNVTTSTLPRDAIYPT